jgi:hypothetical protein
MNDARTEWTDLAGGGRNGAGAGPEPVTILAAGQLGAIPGCRAASGQSAANGRPVQALTPEIQRSGS